jgi:S-formylglutathione hydrolase FrmB
MATTEISPEGCPIHRFTVHSPAMGRDIQAVVVLPPEYEAHPEKRYPILYTFHGHAAPYDTFSAMVPLRQALAEKPMIVTCFDADAASFYIDSPLPQKAGRNSKDTTPVKSLFTTFFLHEFIPAIDKAYRANPAQRMLTGFSMGGFGAFHYMLAAPGQFSAVSSLSGWFESADTIAPHMVPGVETLIGPFSGNRDKLDEFDPFVRVRKQAAVGIKFPHLLLTCGTEDFLLQNNRNMHAFLTKLGIVHEYLETSGAHDWPYWRDTSPAIIDFHWRVCIGAQGSVGD